MNVGKSIFLFCVRLIGLEPTRRKTPDPKSGASTNFATGAQCGCKGTKSFRDVQILSFYFGQSSVRNELTGSPSQNKSPSAQSLKAYLTAIGCFTSSLFT